MAKRLPSANCVGLCLLALLCCVSFHAKADGNMEFFYTTKELSDLLIAPNGGDKLRDESYRRSMIKKLEEGVDQPVNRSLQDVALGHLAYLYHLDGQADKAIQIYARYLNSPTKDASEKLSSAISIAGVAMTSHFPPDEVIANNDVYKKLYEELKDSITDEATRQHYETEYRAIKKREAVYTEQYGREMVKNAPASQSEDAQNAILLPYLVQAERLMSEYAADLAATPLSPEMNRQFAEMNEDRSFSLYRDAQMCQEIEDLYARGGNADAALNMYKHGVSQLNAFFAEYPKTLHSQNCSELLLRMTPRHETPERLAEIAKDIASKVSPGQAMLLGLHFAAGRLSNQDPYNCLLAANELYRIVIDKSKEWYPDDYRDQVNYQGALLCTGENLLRLGGGPELGKILEELSGLSLRGGLFQDMYDNLLKNYRAKFAKEAADLQKAIDAMAATRSASPSLAPPQVSSAAPLKIEAAAKSRVRPARNPAHFAIGAACGITLLIFFFGALAVILCKKTNRRPRPTSKTP